MEKELYQTVGLYLAEVEHSEFQEGAFKCGRIIRAAKGIEVARSFELTAKKVLQREHHKTSNRKDEAEKWKGGDVGGTAEAETRGKSD